MIQNTSFGPLSGSNGPFTIAFWFKSGAMNPNPSYLVDAEGASSQWAVIYGYSANQIEFYTPDPTVRPGSATTEGCSPNTASHSSASSWYAASGTRWSPRRNTMPSSLGSCWLTARAMSARAVAQFYGAIASSKGVAGRPVAP